jgi:segregation and condensation protein B
MRVETDVTPDMLVEQVLMTSPDPLTVEGIEARIPFPVDARASLVRLKADYAGRSIDVVEAAGGWCIRTRPEHSDLCRAFLPKHVRLTRAASETLSVVAHLQPVTRSEIERVRGVSLAKGTLDMLLWAGLVRPGQRRASPGNPMTFVTTERFLRQYDLKSLDGLPSMDEMREKGLLDAQAGVALVQADDGAQ